MIERFRPGEKFGFMVPGRGLVVTEAEAARLNQIAEAIGRHPMLQHAGGRAYNTRGGVVVASEVPETFHARLTSDGPSFSWVEVARDDAAGAWVTLLGGRTSDDGEAREFNSATGLDGKTVLMQRWPEGHHRFQRVRRGQAGPPPPRQCGDCVPTDYPEALSLTFGPDSPNKPYSGSFGPAWEVAGGAGAGGVTLTGNTYAMERLDATRWRWEITVDNFHQISYASERVRITATVSGCALIFEDVHTRWFVGGGGSQSAGFTVNGNLGDLGLGCLDSPWEVTWSGLHLATVRRPD